MTVGMIVCTCEKDGEEEAGEEGGGGGEDKCVQWRECMQEG